MSDTIQIIIFGVIFIVLGVMSLRIAEVPRRLEYLILLVFIFATGIAVTFGIKYFLLNALFFGLGCMVYAAFVLVYRLNRCTNELLEEKNDGDI